MNKTKRILEFGWICCDLSCVCSVTISMWCTSAGNDPNHSQPLKSKQKSIVFLANAMTFEMLNTTKAFSIKHTLELSTHSRHPIRTNISAPIKFWTHLVTTSTSYGFSRFFWGGNRVCFTAFHPSHGQMLNIVLVLIHRFHHHQAISFAGRDNIETYHGFRSTNLRVWKGLNLVGGFNPSEQY